MGRKIVIKGICALSIYNRNKPRSMRGAATDLVCAEHSSPAEIIMCTARRNRRNPQQPVE
eukprot:scaffold20368_cov84-Skeletonema_dohrnii-CCMP3373.AAC.1